MQYRIILFYLHMRTDAVLDPFPQKMLMQGLRVSLIFLGQYVFNIYTALIGSGQTYRLDKMIYTACQPGVSR